MSRTSFFRRFLGTIFGNLIFCPYFIRSIDAKHVYHNTQTWQETTKNSSQKANNSRKINKSNEETLEYCLKKKDSTLGRNFELHTKRTKK